MTLFKPSTADHTALRIESFFLILEFASKVGLWFPSLRKQRGLIKSRTLCSIPLYRLCSRFSLLYTVLNLPVDGVIPVGQVVQIGIHPASVYIVTSGTKTPDDACIKKLENTLLAGAAIGLVRVLLAAAMCIREIHSFASRAKTLLLLNYSFTPAPTASVAID